jgi:hypothetical protein
MTLIASSVSTGSIANRDQLSVGKTISIALTLMRVGTVMLVG